MNTIATTCAATIATLQEEIATAAWPSPEAGFLDYLQTTTGSNAQRKLVIERLDETPILASAGYHYANPTFHVPAGYDDTFAKHFRRLAQKQAFPLDRESYFFRPLDLLGICIGATTCPSITPADRQWLQKVLRDGEQRLTPSTRAHYIGAVAAAHVGVHWRIDPPRRLDETPLPTLSLLYWINNQDDLAKKLGLTIPGPDLASAVLKRTLTQNDNHDDLADAGLILQTIQDVIDKTITARVAQTWHAPENRKAAEALIQHLCDRFPLLTNTLQQRHDNRPTITMTDEYDVQDLLGATLKLHFTDVRPEEWTPSYAGNASRMDFLLKNEQVVVEAKMTRHNLGQKDVANQLAVDILRYQAHQDCKTLVCFVYDPTGKCKNPTALENDLTKDHGALRVIVIVRPHLH